MYSSYQLYSLKYPPLYQNRPVQGGNISTPPPKSPNFRIFFACGGPKNNIFKRCRAILKHQKHRTVQTDEYRERCISLTQSWVLILAVVLNMTSLIYSLKLENLKVLHLSEPDFTLQNGRRRRFLGVMRRYKADFTGFYLKLA